MIAKGTKAERLLPSSISRSKAFRGGLIWFFVLITAPAMAQEAEDIRDVKDLVEIPEPPNYALWLGISVGAILLAVLIWRFLASRKPNVPAQSAAERALAELKDCEKLTGDTSPEPLANAVTAAVRRYIEERFGIAAPRRTTEEFLWDLHANPHREIAPYGEHLSHFLRYCDAVKFGQGGLEQERHGELLEGARRFVEATRNPAPATSPITAMAK